MPLTAKLNLINTVLGKEEIADEVAEKIFTYRKFIEKHWPKELREFVFGKLNVKEA